MSQRRFDLVGFVGFCHFAAQRATFELDERGNPNTLEPELAEQYRQGLLAAKDEIIEAFAEKKAQQLVTQKKGT